MLQPVIQADWNDRLESYITSDSFQKLAQFVDSEYESQTIYPPSDEIFQALNLTSFEDVKVVILGQDPYHGPGQANGLSFSVHPDVKTPPSLVNIYKELVDDLGVPTPSTGDLTPWARQGVLLLNTVLTVRAGEANSHRCHGWEEFTDEIIRRLNAHESPIVYILWGQASIAKKALIDTRKHAVIESPHPSPLAAYRGFFGSKPFSRANNYLTSWNRTPIDWELP